MIRALRPKRLSLAAALLATPVVLSAQNGGEFSPNPPAPGQPVTFTLTDSSGVGMNLPSPCTWYQIRQGSQTGPLVPLPVACGAVIVPIPPGGSTSFTWDQRDANGALVPPGEYWVETRAWDPGFQNLIVDWFCLSIRNPSEPTLTISGAPRVAQSQALVVSSPSDAGAVYFVALALTSNQPVSVLGLSTCLTPPIFADAVTAPVGVLDGLGRSVGVGIAVPNVPALANLGFHTQALVYGANRRVLTNDLSLTIRP